jgi:hypothetical protein
MQGKGNEWCYLKSNMPKDTRLSRRQPQIMNNIKQLPRCPSTSSSPMSECESYEGRGVGGMGAAHLNNEATHDEWENAASTTSAAGGCRRMALKKEDGP